MLCAGAGVLAYFAGAGVCLTPAKLRQHLFVLQTKAGFPLATFVALIFCSLPELIRFLINSFQF